MADLSLSKNFTISGVDTLKAALDRFGRDGVDACGAALYETAENLVTQAKRLTPVDTGNLRASGHVLPPEQDADSVVVRLGFGGPAGAGNQGDTNSRDVGYAVVVHERLDVHHPVGQAKYLEQPVTEAMATIEGELARRAQVILRERGLA